MKLLFGFMSCFMLCLSFVPCGDGFELHTADHEVVAGSGERSHQHDSESCTPFCTCSCCSVVIAKPASPFLLTEKKVHSVVEFPLINISPYFNILSSIWQPPRQLV